jgi:hypothetical protein
MAVENLAAMAEIGKASPFVKEQVALVKYLIMGHNTYINRLMNKSAHLVRDSDDAYECNTILHVTVDAEFEYMQKQLVYLDDWQQEIRDCKRPAKES